MTQPKMKIRKGDKVRILMGKDRGKEGEVTRALPSSRKVIVEGVNLAKRHTKPTRTTMQGGIIDKFMPVAVSSVAILCSRCGPTRAGFRVYDKGRKVRVCRKCGRQL